MDKETYDSLEKIEDDVVDDVADEDINVILDTIYSLSHIRDIEGKDTPSYCFAHDITDIFGLSDEEVKDIALQNGYNVFNIQPNAEIDGGLIIADKDCSKDLIVKDYEKFFGVDIDIEDIVKDDNEE